jgi:hypothetical protein
LTWKGRIFVSLRLYRGVNLLPKEVVRLLKDIRKRFNRLQSFQAGSSRKAEVSASI